MTDDMEMGAIADNYGFAQAIELAVNAGVDMICVASNPIYDQAPENQPFEIIRRAVLAGRISAKRIDEAYARISLLKLKAA